MRLLSDEHNLEGLKKSIIWNLKTNSTTTSNAEEKGPVKSENVSSNDQHIMISYNSASRPLCLKVKSFLESIGHKVWIDVSNIHGASLDSMAKAVEGKTNLASGNLILLLSGIEVKAYSNKEFTAL